jgi:mono/diheme cytochrome c family protein
MALFAVICRMRIARGPWAVGLAICVFGAALHAAAGRDGRPEKAADNAPISFNRDIRPILANNCFACHGPDEKQRETKFHFDTEDGAFAKRGVIVPGNAPESLLIQRITNPDPEEHMPPPDSGHALTERQINLLRKWIDAGAKWDTHCRSIRRNGCAIRSIDSSSPASSARD